MSLLVTTTFAAVLRRDEQQLLRDLPDWPTVQKLSDAERVLWPRLVRLGCIQVERCKDDPIQIWFDIYAGVTPLGRESIEKGVVTL